MRSCCWIGMYVCNEGALTTAHAEIQPRSTKAASWRGECALTLGSINILYFIKTNNKTNIMYV